MTVTKRRWSFRTRLTALIAATFVTGGLVLLGVQYLLVRELFQNAISGLTGCASGDGLSVSSDGNLPLGPDCTRIVDAAESSATNSVAIGTDGAVVLVEQTTTLSEEVLSGLLLWSVVTLLAFTIVAVAAASWLSQRSFARIGQITDTTERITRDDLHQRLNVPGPSDEIKELGDTIDAMLDGLEASFIQQERFITNASHELRTPLTTTRTALEIPLAQGRVPENLEPAVRRALDANQRSEQLVSALLQLARSAKDRSAEEGVEQPVELVPIVERSIAERQDDIENLHLTVTAALSDTTVAAVSETLLTLAIDNLIDNAVRHNVPHGTIHVSTGRTDEEPWVQIGNSGAAFTEEDAARLAEPFNRGPRTRTNTAGRSLGLGLSLVQNIVESVDATLRLRPRPGGGIDARITWRTSTPGRLVRA